MPPIIVADKLTRVYRSYEKEPGMVGTLKSVFRRQWKECVAVNAISFSIKSGEFVGFLGPNGAGKTTTLKMLSGILQPTSGGASVLGYDPSKRLKQFKKMISLVMGQKSQLIWDLPALDTFLLHRDLYDLEQAQWRKAMDHLVEILGLQEVIRRPVRQLSLGERMKCELVVSLLHKPHVLFLDEPTIGLDVVSQKNLWEFLREYQRTNGTTVLLTSHYMQDISNLCSRVIVINKGNLMYDDALVNLIELTQPEKRVSLRFAEAVTPKQIQELGSLVAPDSLQEIDPFNFELTIPRPAFAKVTTQILRDFSVEDMQVEEVDLSTVMQRSFELTSEDSDPAAAK